MRRLLCKAFGHRRNARGARRTTTGWRSTCLVCREPLFRIARGDWRPGPAHQPEATDQLEFLALLDSVPGQSRTSDR